MIEKSFYIGKEIVIAYKSDYDEYLKSTEQEDVDFADEKGYCVVNSLGKLSWYSELDFEKDYRCLTKYEVGLIVNNYDNYLLTIGEPE